jgi:hypothetical protein
MNDFNHNESEFEPDDELAAFEKELLGMAPRGLSDASRQQIAAELAEAGRKRGHRWWISGSAAVAVALSIMLFVAWLALRNVDPKIDFVEQPNERVPENGIVEVPDGANEGDVESQVVWDGIGDESVPNLWAYRRAAQSSYEDIDQLLAIHGDSEMGGGSAYAFADIGGR